MRGKNRCYISGPITNTIGYLERFDRCEHDLGQATGWAIINPARVNSGMPPTTSYGEFMEMCETMMRMCDRIFLMPGWEKSRGCKFEYEYARMHGMKIFISENGELAERAGKAASKGERQ